MKQMYLKVLMVMFAFLTGINAFADDSYYERCTAVSDIVSGDRYIIIIPSSNGATYYAVQQNSDNNFLAVKPETDGTIKNPSSAILWTAAGSTTTENGFTFSCNSKYIYNYSSDTDLNANGTNSTTWLISKLENNEYAFKLSNSSTDGRYISWGTSSFMAYANSNFVNQFTSPRALTRYDGALYIYKYKGTKQVTSLAISGTATKTSYADGDTFDPTGLTVTGTFNDGTSSDVTSRVTWTFDPQTLTTGTTSCVATASLDNVSSSVTVSGLTVTASTLHSVSWDMTKKSYLSQSTDNVNWQCYAMTMNLNENTSNTSANKALAKDNKYTAFYKNQKLTITPTSGLTIYDIEFTCTSNDYATKLQGSTWDNASASISSTNNKLVTVSPTDGTKAITCAISGATWVTSVVVRYMGTVNPPTPSLNTNGYGTYSCAWPVQISDAKVYTAQLDLTQNTITCTQIADGKIPAGTGVLLFKEGANVASNATAEYIDEECAVSNNDLKATTLKGGNLATKESSLVLNGTTFVVYDGDTFTANKAYFAYTPTQAGAKSLTIVFNDDETTNIGIVERTRTNDNIVYNLAGQRVKADAKGIVIVNGKKFIRK